MGFDRPPHGLTVRADLDGVRVEILPYLTDHGRHDLPFSIAWLGVAFGCARASIGAEPELLPLVFGGGGLVGLALALYVRMLLRHWREQTRLELFVGRHELRLTEIAPGRTRERHRGPLRDLGRVDAEEAGYERPRVVAQLIGRSELSIPMERHPLAAAQWLAAELARAAREARARDGGGVAEIPRTLRRMRTEEPG